MNSQFVSPSDPVLSKIARPLKLSDISSKEGRTIIKKMLRVAYGEQIDNKKPLLVGLAAPQIGISKRIILVDVKANGKGSVGDLRVYINPEITFISKEATEWYEGCYSTDRVCGIVNRPTKIKIKAYNQDGEKVVEEWEGYTARIFQHETDHLDGKEFVTHISDDQDLHWVESEEFPLYRNQEAWRNWPKKCPREKWEKIKYG
ncbi:MAG: peptide deformylase [Candidatus Daviesbacteria bacterium]|nr:peptide deformylase [Candidatus Daviesbacteria bacterium]